jgi:3-methyladenine DNA glycosylase AlkD
MARYGINTANAYGVSVTTLREIAREAGKDRALAQRLWDSGKHEARILASLIALPKMVTEAQMESWVKDFDSWDVCDLTCSNLFSRTPFAYGKAMEWSRREEEYVKRAGFVLMAALTVHDKKMADAEFIKFLPVIKEKSTDERNMVKKAVNWALRQIGKRNVHLNGAAIQVAEEIKQMDSKSARWIASDALRELKSEKVQERVKG